MAVEGEPCSGGAARLSLSHVRSAPGAPVRGLAAGEGGSLGAWGSGRRSGSLSGGGGDQHTAGTLHEHRGSRPLQTRCLRGLLNPFAGPQRSLHPLLNPSRSA